MKNILPVIILLFSLNFVFAQEPQTKPLTQAEYVKMLYVLEKDPKTKDELIREIRTRGIGFQLTDGLRSLTRTKGRNDAELQRTLEESNRRREDPSAAKLPSEKEAQEILEKTRQNTLAAIEEMPDFTVKQLVSRGYAYAGTNNWKSLDKLTIAVNYSPTKGEQYRVLAINGALVNAEAGGNYGGLGTSTVGEFATNLKNIFASESKTKFNVLDTDTIRNRRTIIYEYEILIENYKAGLVYKDILSESVRRGEKGKIWIDLDSFRVLKIQSHATDIPSNFPIKAFEKTINFDWVEISAQKYLLPVESDARFTTTSSVGLLQDRNLLRFRNYQKYGSEVQILDEDIEEVPETPPAPDTDPDAPPPIKKP